MKAVADAALARLKATWKSAQVHSAGEVPAPPVTPYVVIYIDSGRDELQLNDGTSGLDVYRLMPMAVGASRDECDRAVDAVKAAFANYRISVAGYGSTPCHLDTSGNYVIDVNGGGPVSKTLFYTFNITKE